MSLLLLRVSCQFPNLSEPHGPFTLFAELSAHYHLTILEHPISRSRFEGEEVTFDVEASGPSPLAHQWLKNGIAVQNIPGRISGAQTASLTVQALASSDQGGYSCRVSHGAQSVVSNEASLTVISPFVSDTFSGVQSGVPISGRLTELGSKTWYSNPNTVGTADWRVSVGSTGNIHANVPYYLGSGYVARVSAKLLPTGSEWVGTGFTSNQSFGVWADGRVWVWIKPNGMYKLCINGVGGPNPMPISNFNSGGYNTVTVEYDRITDQAEVWINGVREYGPAPAGLGTNPSINYAGVFSLNSTAGQTKVDDFALSHHCPGCY